MREIVELLALDKKILAGLYGFLKEGFNTNILQKVILTVWVILMVGSLFHPPSHYEFQGHQMNKLELESVMLQDNAQKMLDDCAIKVVHYGEAFFYVAVITAIAGVLFMVVRTKKS
jgi:hypothetical protein